MVTIITRYNRNRALGALLFPVFALCLTLIVDVSTGFVHSERDLWGYGSLLFGVLWWTYALIPAALKQVRCKYDDLSTSDQVIRCQTASRYFHPTSSVFM